MSRENQHYMTEQERYRLEGYLQAGKSVTWIAERMDFSRKTIYNEIERGTVEADGRRLYSARISQARQEQSGHNKGCPAKLDMDSPLARYLEDKMLGVQEDGTIDPRRRFSPGAAIRAAQNVGYEVHIGVKTLYNYIDQGKFPRIRSRDLWEKPRRKPRRKKRKKKVAHKNLPNIEQRPEEINKREAIGNWEMDLITGKKGTRPCLLTLTERTTREEIIIKIPNKEAKSVKRAIDRLERRTPDFKERFKTITTDNGGEFLEYDKLKQSVYGNGDRFQIYYCHSFSSWEKGTNENHNRMIRRWFPKGTDFSRVTRKEIQACQDWMNDYPRKILGWKTPHQPEGAPARQSAAVRGPLYHFFPT